MKPRNFLWSCSLMRGWILTVYLVAGALGCLGGEPSAELAEAQKLLTAKRAADAIRLLEKLEVQNREGDLAVQILLGLQTAYSQGGRKTDAEKTAEKILDRFPGHPLTEPLLWNVIEKASSSVARNWRIEQYVKQFPQGPHLEEVRKLVKTAQGAETLGKLTEASTRELNDGAETLYQDRQFAEALKVYEQMLKRSPDKDLALFRAGFCHWWLRNYPQAVRLWTQLADTTPKSPYAAEALQMAGRTYTGPLHEGDKALALFARITKDYADTKEAEPAAYSIAILNYWMKRKEAARIAFDQFIRNYPRSVYAPAAEKLLAELSK